MRQVLPSHLAGNLDDLVNVPGTKKNHTWQHLINLSVEKLSNSVFTWNLKLYHWQPTPIVFLEVTGSLLSFLKKLVPNTPSLINQNLPTTWKNFQVEMVFYEKVGSWAGNSNNHCCLVQWLSRRQPLYWNVQQKGFLCSFHFFSHSILKRCVLPSWDLIIFAIFTDLSGEF